MNIRENMIAVVGFAAGAIAMVAVELATIGVTWPPRTEPVAVASKVAAPDFTPEEQAELDQIPSKRAVRAAAYQQFCLANGGSVLTDSGSDVRVCAWPIGVEPPVFIVTADKK